MSRIITARFYIREIVKAAHLTGWAAPAPAGIVRMSPSNKPEANKEWASATPSGTFDMTVRGEAFPAFEDAIGKDVKITIEVPDADE